MLFLKRASGFALNLGVIFGLWYLIWICLVGPRRLGRPLALGSEIQRPRRLWERPLRPWEHEDGEMSLKLLSLNA